MVEVVEMEAKGVVCGWGVGVSKRRVLVVLRREVLARS
jgi:hypothetical protein